MGAAEILGLTRQYSVGSSDEENSIRKQRWGLPVLYLHEKIL